MQSSFPPFTNLPQIIHFSKTKERVRAARDEAGRELLVRALETLEERALADHPGAVRRRSLPSASRSGWNRASRRFERGTCW